MALIALLIAGNPRHLLQNTSGKSCLSYFDDFQRFLRRAMHTSEYQKLIAYPPDSSDKTSQLLIFLTHSLCRAFFVRTTGMKQEAIGLIHRTQRRGEEIKKSKKEPLLKGDSIWNQLYVDDETLRAQLSQFPNGPL